MAGTVAADPSVQVALGRRGYEVVVLAGLELHPAGRRGERSGGDVIKIFTAVNYEFS
jgi:hypothetical protein